MTRDELVELLTENFSPDEEVTFVYDDYHFGDCQSTALRIDTIEEVHNHGHFERNYNPTSGRLPTFEDYCSVHWVQDVPREVIKKKVLRIGE